MVLEVNVTKIVKYVCMAGVSIVAIIFGQRAYREYIRARSRQEATER